MNRIVFWTLTLAIVSQPQAFAQSAKELFKVEGELTDKDARDNVFKGNLQKIHALKLEAGQTVRIDLKSGVIDPYLRLTDEAGKVLAQDDDGGGNLNARIDFKVQKAGNYKLVVTTYDGKSERPARTGPYVLTVHAFGPLDELRAQLLKRSSDFAKLDKDARGKLMSEVKKYLPQRGADLGMDDVDLCFNIFEGLERAGAREKAGSFCNELGPLLAKSTDKEAAGYGEKLIGAGRRLGLPGTEMVLKGMTLQGKEFDWKSYRGKVVLIDFWATWCGPCKAELPNIKKNYEAYKDRGFAVVGISLDHKRADLDRFMATDKIPWVCLFEKDVKDGWDHPMAKYYGVMKIPLAILVDRDGKVISMDAHGPELGRLLEKHIGPKKK